MTESQTDMPNQIPSRSILKGGCALIFACVFGSTGAWASNTYLTPAQKSATWLSGHQNSDGSWGSSEEVRILYTAEAVRTLAAANERNSAYLSGIAWLENHAASNIDFSARRILALASHGDSLGNDLTYLNQAQNLAAPLTGAWGLTESYESAALDTALVLQAMAKLNQTANVQYALDWLKVTQLTGSDQGWALGQNTTSDPVVTAHVILGLQPFTSMDGALAAVISNAASSLSARVSTTSDQRVKALAAVALIRAGRNPTDLLDSLVADQASDGGVANDVLRTAMVGHALAVGAGTDLASLGETVLVSDQALREAINLAMGRNAMDHLNKGDLAKLTSLDIANRGITSLAGLEWATNLSTLDARDNQISSTAPIDGLQIANLYLDGNPITGGNPVAGGGGDSDAPLPAWSLVALGVGLAGAVLRRRRGADDSKNRSV